jgi:hypothetical protein
MKSFKECQFEYSVEFEEMSDGEYVTPEEALEGANKRWQEMCDDGDYEHGRGDATIYCVCADTGKVLMEGEYWVHSDDSDIADGR